VIVRGRARSAVVAEGKLTAEGKSATYSFSVDPVTGKPVT
jgi:hypothetical protein